MNKLKEMVSAATQGTSRLSPKQIALNINKNHGVSVTEEVVEEFLQEEYYEQLETRYTSLEGKIYM